MKEAKGKNAHILDLLLELKEGTQNEGRRIQWALPVSLKGIRDFEVMVENGDAFWCEPKVKQFRVPLYRISSFF